METKKDIYVISLDALDLNLLPISQRYRDGGTVPLWSTSHLDSRRNDYYEFVVEVDNTEKGLNEPVVKNVTCHICDMNVPEVYFNEHKNGFRHKFNRKVADTAFKRLQLYVDKEYNNENNEQLPSKYFCVECSIVINSEDEKSHKQTTAHRSTVLLERFLNDFQNFYTNDDNESLDNKIKDIKTEPVRESKNSKQEYTSNEPNTDETLTTNSLSNSDKQKSITETVTNIKKEKGVSIKEEIKKTKADERTDKKIPRTNPCDLQEGKAMFDIKDGSKTILSKVSDVYYNALVVISESSEYCMMCNYTYNVEQRSVHLESRLHKDNSYAKPLDKNYVRKINRTHHHCALCNQYFTKYDLHVASEEHLANLKYQMIICDSDKTVLDNDNCNTGETVNDSEDSDALRTDDTGSLKDVNKNADPVGKATSNSLKPSTSVSAVHPTVLCDTCNAWISKKQLRKHKQTMRHIFNTLSDYHYLLKLSLDDDNVYCLVCKEAIPNDMDIIKRHFNSRSHVKKYNELLKSHNIVRRYEKKYYCKECKSYILHKNEYMHIKTRKHSDKVGFNETDESDKQSDVSAEAALVHRNTIEANSVTATDNVTVEPSNGTALVAVNQPNNYSTSIDYDMIMVTAIDNFLKNLCDRVNKILDNLENKIIPADVSNTTETSEESVVTVNSYLCGVCNVEVPNNATNISEHNRGRAHNNNLSRRFPR